VVRGDRDRRRLGVVGGPQELIDALLAEPRLEAWPVEPSDDLTVDGDVVKS
jgi:hypothetical protein